MKNIKKTLENIACGIVTLGTLAIILYGADMAAKQSLANDRAAYRAEEEARSPTFTTIYVGPDMPVQITEADYIQNGFR